MKETLKKLPVTTNTSQHNINPDTSITDNFGRVFNYLRIALWERCNLRCVYCMPEDGVKFARPASLLQKDEILRVVRILSRLGVNKIRYTGGEPLLRKDIVNIVGETVAVEGVSSVHLTTNGLLLGSLLDQLRAAGLHGINISLDSLNAEKFEKIARRPGVHTVLENLEKAITAGFDSVKINMVVMRNFNHHEIPDFVELTRTRNITVRFIELMPFDAHQIWKTGHFFGVELMQNLLNDLYPGMMPTNGSSTEHQIYRLPGYKGKVALIPSYTRSLCAECSRIRLTADGKIMNCLYAEDEYDVLKLIRNNAGDEQIADFFKNAMRHKARDGWEAQRKTDRHIRSSMTQIGG